MTSKKVKLILFATLILLLIGIANATEIKDNGTSETDTIENQVNNHETAPNYINKADTTADNMEFSNDKKIDKTNVNEDCVDTSVKDSVKTESKNSTNLYMYPRETAKYGSTIKISGKLLSNEEGIKSQTVKISVNDKNYSVKTGKYGYFTIKYKVKTYGTHKVIFTYAGNTKYLSSTNSSTFTVPRPTNLYIYPRNGDKIGTTIKISGKLQTNKTGIKGEKINITVNNKQYTTTSTGNGYFTINHKITTYDDLKVTFKYAGSNKYLATTNTTTYSVKKPTNLFMYTRNGDKIGTTIKISGKLQTNKTGIKGEKINITVNNKQYTTTTIGNGYFTINHKITTYDNLKVTFKYFGSNKYLSTKNSTIYPVKKPTTLYIYEKNSVPYDTTTKISGKLLYDNKGITGEKINITVNNKEYTTTTTGNGYFTVNHTISQVGKQNIKIKYSGNTNYLATSNSTSFMAIKQNTTLTLNPVSDINYNKNVTITGKLVDSNKKALKDAAISVKLNGIEKIIKTDSNGIYTFTNQTKKVGSNTITVTFAGTNNYLASKNNVTFRVINKPTKLGYDVFDVEYGEYTNITGYLVDDNWQNLIKTLVTININGKNYTTRTDTEGNFYYQYKTEKTGLNNITISFKGTEYYLPVSVSKTFNVNKKDVGILVDTVVTAIQGNTINIDLMLLDFDENPIAYSDILVKINDERFEVTTDKYGEATLKYKTNKLGRNIIDTTYLGNEFYSKSYASDDFIVVKSYDITLPITTEQQYTPVGSDLFITWYQTFYGQSDPGVYLEVYSAYADDMGQITENLVINATFYFKDSKGNVITRQFTAGDGTVMYHNLISGYTPFKVVATYFKMTSYEIALWNNGYAYDAVSGEWYDPDRYYY